ncbi:hypothetical protein OCC_13091 [Thermococcus litoralis DSM 5473]|uniref:Uncharacterized protein n=1 Tax=Thermococcus litoralis (strain ATCC 51850 / DSM 5473 / JCM 8560 / NS-C) TaxID=523849 RepID=H3ZRK5_THELN|nr:hypothetical protein [Thermococcus litoralis]EHR77411.1 hypothetical protein OCC_13091 [Thermococcus litoralis DSM 5473]
MHISFYFISQDRGFPVLITEKSSIFLTREPVPFDEFKRRINALVFSEADFTDLFEVRIFKKDPYIEIKLSNGTKLRTTIENFLEGVNKSVENLSRVISREPVHLESLVLKIISPPSCESRKSCRNEYELEIYGESLYIISSTVYLDEYLSELIELRDFIKSGKLPRESWRIIHDLDGKIREVLSMDTSKPENRGMLLEFTRLKGLSKGASPPLIRFTFAMYDPFEVIYVAESESGSIMLIFILYAQMAVVVKKESLLKSIERAIQDARNELEKLEYRSERQIDSRGEDFFKKGAGE